SFDKARLSGNGLEIVKNGIEPLNVANLENRVVLAGEGDEVGGFIRGIRHRFFNEEMTALGEELAGDLEMGMSGSDNAESVGRVGRFADGSEGASGIFIRDAFGCGGIEIMNAREVE